jgi:sigma-B regulation protein RsbU (phosphoserine phosphatase)
MEPVTSTYFREQLQERRHRLSDATSQPGRSPQLVGLLRQVDAALERMENGSFGLCEVCHDPIETDRLLADPLLCFCLDHLNTDQQRALEADLGLAARIQGVLLPQKQIQWAGWEASYHYVASGPVSGDYCDFITTESGDSFFLLGDISGKGVAASMLMSHLHAIFRALIPLGLSLNEVVTRANRLFCESTLASSYATVVCGKAGGSGEVELCNAGHCPPLAVRSGQLISLGATGLPIGLFCDAQFGVEKLELKPEDSLLLYTDGITEARNQAGEEYGEPRLTSLLATHHSLLPSKLIEVCLRDLAAFLRGEPLTDDQTMMVLRRRN